MVKRRRYGTLPDGSGVDAIALGSDGVELEVLTYGCVITSLAVPGAGGRKTNVVLGFDRLESYIASASYFGAAVGRYANRIANARFALDGREHQVSANEPPNHLHGGFRGFDKRVWDADASDNGAAVVFRRRSVDGEEGYPGNVDVQITYRLDGCELRMEYEAVTEMPTHVNLTHHSYFNLRGEGDVLEHCLAINASTYLPVADGLIPTGEIAPVANSPFDFQESTAIGLRIRTDHEQLRRGGGYDHNFNLNRTGTELAMAARVFDPSSRRTLEVRTTEPGVQFYSGQGVSFRGFCLEPQHYPDSPNRPEFPSTVLRPGERYRSTTVYVFDVAR